MARGYDARACQNRQPVQFHGHPGQRSDHQYTFFFFISLSGLAMVPALLDNDVASDIAETTALAAKNVLISAIF